jgi:hypothetical protein
MEEGLDQKGEGVDRLRSETSVPRLWGKIVKQFDRRRS